MSYSNQQPVRVFAPASIGNVGVGFDSLGLALAPLEDVYLGDRITISCHAGKKDSLICSGPFVHHLPEDEDNLVMKAVEAYFAHPDCQALEKPTLRIELEKYLPVGSGLGSSACSVVAALTAMNQFMDDHLDDLALMKVMAQLEGGISGSMHFDNIAPCYFGGMQLMVPSQQQPFQQVPAFTDWYWVMAFPGFKLNTAASRAVLPKELSLQESILFAQYLSGFVSSSYQQNEQSALDMLKDVVAEPHRAVLIQGFAEAKKALTQEGETVVGISGAGPTLFAVCREKERAEQCVTWLKENYLQSDEGFVHICRAAEKGAKNWYEEE